ncbi:MAG: QueT transporter family protein [Promethearchaeota archaeon]
MSEKNSRDNTEKESAGYSERSKSLKAAIIAITAALYIALGYIFQPISFLGVQFRVAEIIVGMCVIFPLEGLIGNVIGVFFINLSSPLGPIDLLSCLVNVPALYCIIYFRDKGKLMYIGGLLYSIIISLYVAIILNIVLYLPILLMFIQVFISEIILATLGIMLFDYIKKQIL